nr:unnamed protein product [Digitaria exilis]
MAANASSGSKPSLLSTLPNDLPLEFLQKITQGFSKDLMLGQGAFGTVYKGTLQDGQPIAVKKLADNSPVPPKKEFQKEVGNLMAIQHTNIVRLLGYCRETQRKAIENNGRYIIVDVVESLLCYEYIPNGNLGKYIFDKSSRPDWKTCFEIIKGICQGLCFLHGGKDTHAPIVHLNLQPSNILLGDNMVPKISDFDLTRIFGGEHTRINTVNVVGKKLTPLILQVQKIWTNEHIASVYSELDPVSLQEVRTCIEIALKCVVVDQNKRPSIAEIVDEINGMKAH